MSSPIIEVRNLSKLYRLGQIGRASLIQSARYRWRILRGKPTDDLDDASAHLDIEPERRGPVPNSFWAVRDVSFDVNEGEVLGIIGKNGAGKSTLLKILSRITEPTSGYAKMRGRVASLLEVGTGFHADLTGRENVYLNGTILGLKKPEIDAKLDEIIDFSGVEKFIDTPVKRYSSGMTVRLAFAVAAHLDPEILIIDEVLAVGDADFQSKCLGKMKDVASQGRTVIFVSHQLPLVTRLCTRVLLMKQGSVVNSGPPQDMVALYLAHRKSAGDSIGTTHGEASPIDISQVQILSHRGEPSESLEVGKPWTVRFNLTSPTSFPSVTIAVGLQTMDGHTIRGYWTPRFELPSGRCVLEFQDAIPAFTPGTYDLIIGITSRGRAIFENLHARRLTWSLTDFPLHSQYNRPGTCINEMSWKILEQSSN